MDLEKPINLKEAIDKIGRNKISSKLGVDNGAVSVAVHRGKLPCSWYRTVKLLGKNAGLEIPYDYFPWKTAVGE